LIYSIIVAVSENNAIGLKGKMPWHNSDDLKFFKETTMGHPILMGRKTFESLGKPLPGRLNIIVTKNKSNIAADNVLVLNDLNQLNSFIDSLKNNHNYKNYNYDKCFIIGGGSIYQQFIDKADEIILSRIKGTYEADTFFPTIDNNWEKVSIINKGTFTVEIYKRK